MVNNESRIRNLSVEGVLEDKKCRLLTIMKREYEFNSLVKLMHYVNPGARAFYSVLTSLPSIFHSEMRTSSIALNKILLKVIQIV